MSRGASEGGAEVAATALSIARRESVATAGELRTGDVGAPARPTVHRACPLTTPILTRYGPIADGACAAVGGAAGIVGIAACGGAAEGLAADRITVCDTEGAAVREAMPWVDHVKPHWYSSIGSDPGDLGREEDLAGEVDLVGDLAGELMGDLGGDGVEIFISTSVVMRLSSMSARSSFPT